MVKIKPKGNQTAATKSKKIPAKEKAPLRRRRRRSIINSLPIHLGLIFNGLSVGLGCANFALSLVYIVGVIGTQEPKFDEISCQNLTLNVIPNVKPDFVLPWQCNYFQIEFWTGSMTAIAGLFQMLFCLVVVLSDQVGWNAWMYPHVAVAALLAVSIILLFVVFSTTADRSLYHGLRGTPSFWHEASPHMGITNADPGVIKFLVLFYSAWMWLDFIFCFFAIFIANEKRRTLKKSAKENIQSARAKSESDKSITSYPESKQDASEDEGMKINGPERLQGSKIEIEAEEKVQPAVPVGVQGNKSQNKRFPKIVDKRMKRKTTNRSKASTASSASGFSQPGGLMRQPPKGSKLKKKKGVDELTDF